MTLGEAQSLGLNEKCVDVLLLMGPLYHLRRLEERRAAFSEARRVLKKSGLLIVTAISRFASLIDGFARGFINDPEFNNIIDRDLDSGIHQNPTDNPEYFTDAFFHRPEELIKEICESGLFFQGLIGIEGPGWAKQALVEVMDDKLKSEELLRLLAKWKAR